jgi:hypothetical protein
MGLLMALRNRATQPENGDHEARVRGQVSVN